MPTKDTRPTKDKIIEAIKKRGPSLPVHIANETGLSMLFASAFLGELLSAKELKIAHMKVGSSPIYLIPGQEPDIEKFAQHLKSKEKEAYELVKEKEFLLDSKQQPAIRVALREIKDFAIPFNTKDGIIWRYFTKKESEYAKDAPTQELQKETVRKEPPKEKQDEKEISKEQEKPQEKDMPKEIRKEEKSIEKEAKSEQLPDTEKREKVADKELNIFDKKPKPKPKKASQKQNQKFFEKVKASLNEKSIEILDIIGVGKNELILKIRKNEQEKLLIAHNKRRIDESDIISAHKKARELELPFLIYTKGDQTKKFTDFLNAAKALDNIDKFE